MSRGPSRHPNLRGIRTGEETAAVWDLAREGRDPDIIARSFTIAPESVEKIRQWQIDQGIVPKPPCVPCQHCGCSGACR